MRRAGEQRERLGRGERRPARGGVPLGARRAVGRDAGARGFALLEMIIALALLAAGMVGVASIFASVTSSAHSQADLSEDTALCQSKMETLRSLSFTDSSTNTTELNSSGNFPTTGGTGLSPGGSTSSGVIGYEDYLDGSGNLLSSASGAIYQRWWSIAQTSGSVANLKTVSVRCTDLSLVGTAQAPDLTLTTVISQ